jgi:thiol-disulfide isomerase/thioredoxin
MLQNNDVFPSRTFARVGGGEIHLPADLAGWFGVVLFHRGSWCPPCNAQLAAFTRAADKFAGEGIKVVSVSIDDREKIGKSTSSISRSLTAPTRERLPQSPAPSSMTIPSVSRQPASSVYSTRAIGRLMSDDVLGFVRHLKSLAKD